MGEENIQIRNSFDEETLRKIAKGIGITAFYSVAVFVLSVANGMDFGNAILNGFIVQIIPTLLNILKEWHKGQMPSI